MQQAFICDALRTPFGRYGGALAGIRADDLAALPLAALLARQPASVAQAIDDVIYGCANSAAKIGESAAWQQRAAQVSQYGMAAIADGAAARWFTPAFCERAPATVQALLTQLRACDAESYADCCDALASADLRHELAAIHLPVLVIAGRDDAVTTVADAEAMVAHIHGAQLVVLPASHLSSVEVWLAFNRALQPFIDAQLTQQQRYQQGMTVRRAVLGDAHVDRTLRICPL